MQIKFEFSVVETAVSIDRINFLCTPAPAFYDHLLSALCSINAEFSDLNASNGDSTKLMATDIGFFELETSDNSPYLYATDMDSDIAFIRQLLLQSDSFTEVKISTQDSTSNQKSNTEAFDDGRNPLDEDGFWGLTGEYIGPP